VAQRWAARDLVLGQEPNTDDKPRVEHGGIDVSLPPDRPGIGFRRAISPFGAVPLEDVFQPLDLPLGLEGLQLEFRLEDVG
jgi:hypothetical protein